MIDVEHGALRAFKHDGLTIRNCTVQQHGRVRHEGSKFVRGLRILLIHFVRIKRLRVKQRVRNHILFATSVFDVLPEQIKVEQVDYAESPAASFVFIRRTNSTGSGSNLHPPRRVLRSQLDHAVIRKDHVSAIADKEITVNFHSGFAQRRNFFQERDRIEHNSIADYTKAAFTKNSTRDELQHEPLTINDDRVPGVVAARVPRDHRELFRKHVYNFALAFVAPLGANHHGCLTVWQSDLLLKYSGVPCGNTLFAHTRRAALKVKKSGINRSRGVPEIITCRQEEEPIVSFSEGSDLGLHMARFC